jgi:DNA-binding transcriptional LysR family regulator
VFSAHAGSELERLLRERKLDIVVTQQDLAGPQYASRTLFNERAKVAVSRQLSGGRELSAQKLAHLPCLAYKADPPFLKEWLAAAGMTLSALDVRVVCDDWVALAAMVDAGLGFCVLPGSIAVDPERCATHDVPAAVLAPLAFRAYFHRDLLEVPALRALIKGLPK